MSALLTTACGAEIPDVPTAENRAEEQNKILLQPASIDLAEVKKYVFSQDKSDYTLDLSREEVKFLTSENGLSINYDDYNINGCTMQWDKYNDFIHFRRNNEMIFQTDTDIELDFMSKEEVRSKANDFVEKLGIPFEIGEIKIEAYNADYLNELIENIKSQDIYTDFVKQETLESSWDDSDSLYFAEVGFCENGIPICQEDVSLRDGTSLQGMKMKFYLTKEGIQDFSVTRWKEKTEHEKIPVCSVEKGLEVIRKKYNNIVTEDKIDITDVKLEYLMIPSGLNGKLYLTPVWKFDTKSSVVMNLMDGSSAEASQSQTVVLEESIFINGETERIIE